MEKIRGRAFDILTSLITVVPNQGNIGPYEKVPVNFRCVLSLVFILLMIR